MSTRRARIKAVTSLPPRRKNADNSDNKTKPTLLKEESQKSENSPKTPQSTPKNNETEKSIKSPPGLIPLHNSLNVQKNSPQIKSISDLPKNSNGQKTPKASEKVPVISSAPAVKSVFASPHPRTESPVRNTASPVVPSPKLISRVSNINLHKPASLHTEKVNQDVKSCILSVTAKQNDAGSETKSDVPDDYNVPSVPESISDETVMDGIILLQPTRSAPKPLDLLKNEIISENAEVLFDPIVPLPSPSKVRPKLRPMPRLTPLRRNSVQGSASESEDESRRLLGGALTPAPSRQRHDSHTSHSTLQSVTNRVNRVRNDSICSSVSQTTTQPLVASSPVKEKHINKNRRQEMSRRVAAMRRRREAVKRGDLTMFDLIFYNPTTNPIIPDQDEIKAKEANKREEVERKAQDEEVDDPPAGDAPVPQIKLGPNGEIILDEQSLTIKQTDSKRKVSSVVREGAWGAGGGKYTRATRTADWSHAETVRFYRALAAIGTDFTLMAPLFPDRTRRNLKSKFKKEEKINGAQVDKALRSATSWDAIRLQEEFEEERREADVLARNERERLLQKKQEEAARAAEAKEQQFRRSRGARALEKSVLANPRERARASTANGLIQQALQARADRAERAARARARPHSAADDKRCKDRDAPNTPFATLTLLSQAKTRPDPPPDSSTGDMATLSKVGPSKSPGPPMSLDEMGSVPSNIESGSLVVLTVNDPSSPSKKMLQTYIAHGAGRLTPVSLPPNFLNSVVGYMKKGTSKNNASGSPQFTSPTGANLENRTSTPSMLQMNPSPAKRQRHSSYTITQL